MNLTLQTIPSTTVSEILINSKLDGVILDTEHGYFNNETLFSCIQVITATNKTCIIRFTDLNKQLVRMCLDAGADGVLFSTVEDPKVAEEMVKYCQYPKFGGNRGAAIVRENKWGKEEMNNRKPIVMGQIETKRGVDNIDSILQCGFDKFVIGPYDLSASLGCIEEWNNPLYLEYLDKIYSRIPSEKLGSFLPRLNDMKVFQESNRKKPSLLIWGLDVIYMIEGMKQAKID